LRIIFFFLDGWNQCSNGNNSQKIWDVKINNQRVNSRTQTLSRNHINNGEKKGKEQEVHSWSQQQRYILNSGSNGNEGIVIVITGVDLYLLRACVFSACLENLCLELCVCVRALRLLSAFRGLAM
jgi:hypothetical protein